MLSSYIQFSAKYKSFFPKLIKYLHVFLYCILLKSNHQSYDYISELYITGLILIYFLDVDISSINTLLAYDPNTFVVKFHSTL